MWTAHRAAMGDGAGDIVTISEGERLLNVRDVVARWGDDEAFRDFFADMLAASSCEAFFWEMPPIEHATLAHAFECAVIGSGALARTQADDADFAKHLGGTESVAAFENLGGDALLIAPRHMSDTDCYGHIAAFIRRAPRAQQHTLLRRLSLEIEKRLAATCKRFWVSTSGLGVPWVHMRLDERPKYYQYAPYAGRTVPTASPARTPEPWNCARGSRSCD